MKPKPIWNSILPVNIYVILNANGTLICEQQADYAHMALRQAKEEWGHAARVAIEKKQWLKMQAAEAKWVKASRRAEA